MNSQGNDGATPHPRSTSHHPSIADRYQPDRGSDTEDATAAPSIEAPYDGYQEVSKFFNTTPKAHNCAMPSSDRRSLDEFSGILLQSGSNDSPEKKMQLLSRLERLHRALRRCHRAYCCVT